MLTAMKTTILGVVLAAGLMVPVLGREIVVDLNGGGEFTEIQAAIDTAEHGDVVLVAPAEYVITKPITFNGKAITVKGDDGPAATTIRMSKTPANHERASVVIFENREREDSVLAGFTLTGGRGYASFERGLRNGGGISCDSSSPTIENCTISDNSTNWTGGMAVADGQLWVSTDAGPIYCFAENTSAVASPKNRANASG